MVGFEEGIKEGSIETKKEIILNLHHNNISIGIIANSTNLSIDEVNEIIKLKEKDNNIQPNCD